MIGGLICMAIILAWGAYTLGHGIGWRAGFRACENVDDAFDRRMRERKENG